MLTLNGEACMRICYVMTKQQILIGGTSQRHVNMGAKLLWDQRK